MNSHMHAKMTRLCECSFKDITADIKKSSLMGNDRSPESQQAKSE